MFLLIITIFPFFISASMFKSKDRQSSSFALHLSKQSPVGAAKDQVSSIPNSQTNQIKYFKADVANISPQDKFDFKSLYSELVPSKELPESEPQESELPASIKLPQELLNINFNIDDDQEMINIEKNSPEYFVNQFLLDLPQLESNDFYNRLQKLRDIIGNNQLEHICREKAYEIFYKAICDTLKIEKNLQQYCSEYDEYILYRHWSFIKTLFSSQLFQSVLFRKDENNLTIFNIIKNAKKTVPKAYELFCKFNYDPIIKNLLNFQEILSEFKAD